MSGRRACCAFLAVLLTLNVIEASFDVSINPRHVHINKTLQLVTFTCNVDVPLTGCQFHFLSSLGEKNTPLDCSAENVTKNFGASLPRGVQDYHYTGDGLDKGQCGITLKVEGFKQWVVGCRVKAAQGSWQYAFTDLYARDDFLAITANPETSIVLPGDKLSVMCSIPDYPLFSCSFSIKGLHKDNEIDFNSGMASPESRYPHFYQGTGLNNGQCGITLHNVSERHNGPGFCRLNDDDDAQGVGFFSVVVAAPPDKPVLRLDVISLENGLINATCFVNGGRPAPNITWLLGGKTLRHDGIDDTDASLKDGWMWPWNLTSTTQKLVYELKPDDEGKVLMCIVSHVALVKPLEAIRLIPSKITRRLDETETDEVTTTSTPKKNAKYCHRLTSMTVDISCVYQSRSVPCNIKAMFNTEALATCKEGFASLTDETERSMTCQENGKWSTKLLICNKEHAKSCHRLTSITVDLSCVYQSKPVPCNMKAMFNTEALATCKEGFASFTDETNRSMTCQENGKWSTKLLHCNKAHLLDSTYDSTTSALAPERETKNPPHLERLRLQPPPPPEDPAGAQAFPELWLDQDLDHFNNADNRTWRHRYFHNDRYYVAGGPTFIYIYGDQTAESGWLYSGQMIELAVQHRATAYLLEHRYFGKSQPTKDASVENLQYLSTEQALADIATLIIHARDTDDRKGKVVLFGGSYAGNLAAWARLKYPHLIHAAVASSAPLQAKVDFPEYYKVVATVMDNSSNTCLENIREAVSATSAIMEGPDGGKKITAMFNLCTPLDVTNKNDVVNFYSSFAAVFANVVRDTPNVEKVGEWCSRMTDTQYGNTAFERYVNFGNTSIAGGSCMSIDFDSYVRYYGGSRSWNAKALTTGAAQWLYLTCSQFGYYQTSSSVIQPFGDYFPAETSIDLCEAVFSSRFTKPFVESRADRINMFFGSKNIKVDRVVFVQGSLDPWHVLGINQDLSPDAPAVVIEGSSHCADLPNTDKNSSPQLREGKAKIAQYVAKWLNNEQ